MANQSHLPEHPEHIGPYVIKKKIGAGGFGTVYLGFDDRTRAVAVKRLGGQIRPQPQFKERFDREILAAQKLSGQYHPELKAFGTDDAGVPWFATPYIPGPTLSQIVLRDGRVPREFAWALAAGLCDGLLAIHEAQLVHRDLYPNNVMLARSGPVIIDLGLVRFLDGSLPPITDDQTRLGALGFMAPETTRRLLEAGQPADVFSFAATLVFAATGHAPYHGTMPEILSALHECAPPDLTGMPRSLRAFVEPCFQGEPDDRPSLSELRDLLPAAAAGSFSTTLPIGARRIQEALAAELKAMEGVPFTVAFDSPDFVLTRRIAAVPDPDATIRAAARALVADPGANAQRLIRLANLGAALYVPPARAESALAAERAAAAPASGRAQFDALVTRLSDEQIGELTVLELGPAGCTVWRLTPSPVGGVVQHAREHTWAALLRRIGGGLGRAAKAVYPEAGDAAGPGPGPDPDLLALALAGGLEVLSPAVIRPSADWRDTESLAESLAAAIAAELAGPDGGQGPDRAEAPNAAKPLVVLRRAVSWAVVDLVADFLHRRLHADADAVFAAAGPFGQFVEAVLQRLPPRWPLGLVIAEVDDATDEVSVEFVPLFEAGLAADAGSASRVVRLTIPDLPADQLLLPIVAQKSADPAGWELVSNSLVDDPRPGPLNLVAMLDGRDQVSLSNPAGGGRLATAAGRWEEVRSRIPAVLRRRGAAPVDLVVAVELGSSDLDIEPRRQFAAALLDQLAHRQADGLDVRAALVGYGDHLLDNTPSPNGRPRRPRYENLPLEERRRYDPIIDWTTFDSPATISRALPQLQAVHSEHDFAAPVEEVLAKIAHAGWRPGAQHVLVFVGSRPPHPARSPQVEAIACTYHIAWQAVLQDAQADLGLVCAAVVEPLTRHFTDRRRTLAQAGIAEADLTWQHLVRKRLYALGAVEAATVLASVGIRPAADRGRQAVPLPLAFLRGAHPSADAPSASNTPIDGLIQRGRPDLGGIPV